MGCAFCATARLGLRRNLTPAEIVGQVLAAFDVLMPDERITNLVFMGMGEPLANYESLVQAIEILTADWGVGLSGRRITVSTVGLVPAMERLVRETPVNLAVSLIGDDRRPARRADAGEPTLSAGRAAGDVPRAAHPAAPAHHLRVRHAGRRQRFAPTTPSASPACCTGFARRSISSRSIPFPARSSRVRPPPRFGDSRKSCSPSGSTPRCARAAGKTFRRRAGNWRLPRGRRLRRTDRARRSVAACVVRHRDSIRTGPQCPESASSSIRARDRIDARGAGCDASPRSWATTESWVRPDRWRISRRRAGLP